MATKITLGGNPKHFTKPVEIILIDGSTDKLSVRFIYRTRSQFAEMADKRTAEIEAAIKAEIEKEQAERAANPDAAPARISTSENYRRHDEMLADQVLLIADGWELQDEFNKESLLQLEDKFPGSLQRIARVYAQAVAEVRAKN
jgi:hypothetical protein